MKTLVERCAVFGWTLRPEGNGWELLGNGTPASFRSTETLVDWLQYQERTTKHVTEHNVEQLAMELEAA